MAYIVQTASIIFDCFDFGVTGRERAPNKNVGGNEREKKKIYESVSGNQKMKIN